ncbi:MAG: hypothetical protein HYX92_06465 [Chloroflexi bacterium]|nr:hypothetical protein [Chloroflexota bacterium]
MNVMRYTVIDGSGGVSFVAHCDVCFALMAACATGPQTLQQLLDFAELYYGNLSDYVQDGLAVFDEWNRPGRYEPIHAALATCPPERQPVFRVVDDITREASLRPVKAGVVVFNLRAKRVIQLQNSYIEIQRKGRAKFFDGSKTTDRYFTYRLPAGWALVP